MARKLIKIFGMASHTFIDRVSGTDYLRIIQPMKYLDGLVYKDVKFKVTVFDHSKGKSFDWRDILQEYDMVYFNYTTNDIGYAIMGCLAQKYNKKLICDVDDDLFNILTDNPAYEIFKKGAWGRTVVKAVLDDVFHVTCTNSHLKHSIEFNTKKTTDKITVLPNYIDLSVYKHRCPFKDRGYYKAIHFGSSTHSSSIYNDVFVKAVDRVMKEYPNFSFLSIGSFIPKLREKWGRRYEQGFGDGDLMKWIKIMPKYMDDADFLLVPLINNTYNRSKSNTKRWEASSYKIPFIGQRIRQYNEVITEGIDGYLCSTEDEWYRAITLMINDAKKRKEIGEAGFQRTVKEGQMKDNVWRYAELFIKINTP
jgi:glycosyltransferase involved in cell wall biosynthesis